MLTIRFQLLENIVIDSLVEHNYTKMPPKNWSTASQGAAISMYFTNKASIPSPHLSNPSRNERKRLNHAMERVFFHSTVTIVHITFLVTPKRALINKQWPYISPRSSFCTAHFLSCSTVSKLEHCIHISSHFSQNTAFSLRSPIPAFVSLHFYLKIAVNIWNPLEESASTLFLLQNVPTTFYQCVPLSSSLKCLWVLYSVHPRAVITLP